MLVIRSFVRSLTVRCGECSNNSVAKTSVLFWRFGFFVLFFFFFTPSTEGYGY